MDTRSRFGLRRSKLGGTHFKFDSGMMLSCWPGLLGGTKVGVAQGILHSNVSSHLHEAHHQTDWSVEFGRRSTARLGR